MLLKDAMENGAAGFSTGLIYTPCCYATTDEIVISKSNSSIWRNLCFSYEK